MGYTQSSYLTFIETFRLTSIDVFNFAIYIGKLVVKMDPINVNMKVYTSFYVYFPKGRKVPV